MKWGTPVPFRASITSASGRYQVRGMGAEEFPELPVVERVKLYLPAEALIEDCGVFVCH